MYHHVFEDDDGNTVQEFDDEAIEYFLLGLQQLRDECEPGEGLSTPSMWTEDNGTPVVGEFILRKVNTPNPESEKGSI